MNNWENLKQSLSISDMITKETGIALLRQGASGTLSECPFCGSGTGKNRSSAFSIKKDDKVFKCFACDKSGDAVNFISALRNTTDGDSIKYLLHKYGNGVMQKSNTDYSEWDKKLYAIKNNQKSKATVFLREQRKLDISKLPLNSYYYDSYYDAVVFPAQNEQLLNLRFINPEKDRSKSINIKQSEEVLKKDCIYDASFNKDEEIIHITEGVINGLSLFPLSSISIFDAGNKVSSSLLRKYIENKIVVLAFDNDDAGAKAADYYLNLIENTGLVLEVRKFVYPDNLPNNFDINDILVNDKLAALLKRKSSHKLLYENKVLKPIIETSNDIDEDFNMCGYYTEEGRYYGRDQKGNPRQISNFLMDIIYHFPDGSRNSLRYIKLQKSINGIVDTKFILLDTESLSSVQKFKASIYSHGEFVFKGSGKDLDAIKESLGISTENAIKVDTLGWSSDRDAFVFSNGIVSNGEFKIINKFGIVNANEHRLFIPALSEIYKDDSGYSEERKFVFSPGTLTVNTFSQLIDKAYGINGQIGLFFTLSSIFSDIIYSTIDFFPLLFLYGTAGSGKTSFANFFLGFFGQPQNSTSLSGSSTSKSILRKLAQYSNGLLFLNEYKSDTAGKVDDMLVNVYDRVGYDRALLSNDNRTHQTAISSGVMVDGNFLPIKHPRTYSRLIQLDFMEKGFTNDQKKAYKQLEDILKNQTFSSLTFEILKFRILFKREFRNVYYQTYDELKTEYSADNFDNRILVNNCVVLSVFKILRKPLNIPYNYETTVSQLMEVAKVQQGILSQTNEAEQFFEAIETNITSSELFHMHTLDTSALSFHYPTAYMVYAEHMRKTGGLSIDKQAMKKLLERNQYFISQGIGKKINNKTIRVMSFNSCVINNSEKE